MSLCRYCVTWSCHVAASDGALLQPSHAPDSRVPCNRAHNNRIKRTGENGIQRDWQSDCRIGIAGWGGSGNVMGNMPDPNGQWPNRG
eukprot:scaffold14582_cov108-Isochrysis_galbana.AAC.12